jgi:Tfp pilus assembly protein PilV
MKRVSSNPDNGSSLIEVMLAVALMAVTALGLIAVQLWTAREARALAMREQAVLIADSTVESMHAPSADDTLGRQWAVRAAASLPKGDVSVSDTGGAVSTARVTWTALRNLPHSGDVIDKPESCGGVDVPSGAACVALAFTR